MFEFFYVRGQVIPHLGPQDGDGTSASVCVSERYVKIVLVSCCIGVARDFTVCREVHVPLRKQFVFHLKHMDGNIKSNFFCLF